MVNEAVLNELSGNIAAALPSVQADMRHQEITLTVAPDALYETLRLLRDDQRFLFETLVDICGVDYPDRAARFDVVYHFLSMKRNIRIRVKTAVALDAAVLSVVGLFPAANWFEREAFDMYGILFDGHPDLRRILTDYGFVGYPLRKDFPLTGYVEVRYNDEEKRVVYEPVKLQQEFRSFDYLSPWEGQKRATATLPGDEKATKA